MGKIKGWEKRYDNNNGVSWESKNTTIIVSKWFSPYGKIKKGYDVTINEKPPSIKRIFINGMDRATFSSKEKALAFAKKYMRKYPKG